MLYRIYELSKRKNGRSKPLWESRFNTRAEAVAWMKEKQLDYPGLNWDMIILSVGE